MGRLLCGDLSRVCVPRGTGCWCLSFYFPSRVCVWLNMGRIGLSLGWALGLILDDGWIYIGRCVNLYRLRREAI